MADRPYPSPSSIAALRGEMNGLLDRLQASPNGDLVLQALTTLTEIGNADNDRLDLKILSSTLKDIERAFRILKPYQHNRKIAIFGSARTSPQAAEYQMAKDFAACVTSQGFMVITGGGGGIMEAGNEGAGNGRSLGLNIELPFEQGSNTFISSNDMLVTFKYFFTRKLFFLKESDALAVFPGGFGTQDEAFECLTLSQTGKSVPIPIVLIDKPGGDYWRNWATYIEKNLLGQGLIGPNDFSLFTITDRLDVACETISSFYTVYHSSRYVDELLVLRLRSVLSDEAMHELNERFSDILVKGKIERSTALPKELHDETFELPRLTLHFNQRDLGRLYELIRAINRLGCGSIDCPHPEQK
jgi:uncharacterized protein (TIGR00730 family)